MTTTLRLGGLCFLALGLACTRPASAPSCPPGALGPGALDRGLLILGELHGTEQAPAIALATACEAARRDGRAWIGLEQPTPDQPRVDAYLAGGPEAAMLDTERWQRPVQDGLNSEAMLGLLRQVRALRAQGLKLDVVHFDVEVARSGDRARDAHMATALQKALKAHPGGSGVVLVGNAHATRRLQLPKSLGWHLTAAGVPFRTLNIALEGGTAWMAGLTGGITPLGANGPKAPADHEGFTLDGAPDGFDGWWYAGLLKASLPAVKHGEGAGAAATP